jgi:integrase
MRALHGATLHEAQAAVVALRAEGKRKAEAISRPSFAKFALSVMEAKVRDGRLASAKTRERWAGEIEALARAELASCEKFGGVPVDGVTKAQVEEVRERVAARVAAGTYSPTTANSLLRTLRQLLQRAARRYGREDPTQIDDYFFPLRGHRTYTREAPNALTPEQAARFLAEMRESYPQHYAFVLLGIVTGLRPSSLRPLRWRGAEPDVLWDRGSILVRRSHSLGDDVMDATKTGVDQELALPEWVMRELAWHRDLVQSPPRNERGAPPLWWRKPMAESDLLFPGRDGGFRARSSLDGVFRAVAKAAGVPHKVTPRAMRRTFKDVARRAGVSEAASRAVSGHQTEQMHQHYQTVGPDEMRSELERVAALLTDPSGVRKGV